MAPISHFLHAGGGEKYFAEQQQCKVSVENATVGTGNGNQMHDIGESFTADVCHGRSKYFNQEDGKKRRAVISKGRKAEKGEVRRRDKKSSVCHEHSEGHLRQRRHFRDQEPQPPTLAVKALGEFVLFVIPFRKLESREGKSEEGA